MDVYSRFGLSVSGSLCFLLCIFIFFFCGIKLHHLGRCQTEDSPFLWKRAEPLLSPSFCMPPLKFAATSVLYHFEQPCVPRFPCWAAEVYKANHREGAFIFTGSVQVPAGSLYPNRRPHLPHSCKKSRTGRNDSHGGGRACRASLGPGRLRSHSFSQQAMQQGRPACRGFRATMELGLF